MFFNAEQASSAKEVTGTSDSVHNDDGSTEEQSTSSSQEQPEPNSTSGNTNANYNLEEVAVVFDYQPPVTTSASTTSEPLPSSTSPSQPQRLRLDLKIRRFYKRNRLNHCFTGFLTSLIFLAIGVTFVATELPDYIGVLFILVSLPPLFMTINKWRHIRRQDRIRREILQRRRALRRIRERSRENESYRQNNLPNSDLPPTYENLGFDEIDFDIDVESQSNTSSYGDEAPPDYEEEEIK